MPDADVIPIGGQPERRPRKRASTRSAPAEQAEPASELESARRIGTDGAPGRGSGRAKPSSASRGLAPAGASGKRPVRKAAAKPVRRKPAEPAEPTEAVTTEQSGADQTAAATPAPAPTPVPDADQPTPRLDVRHPNAPAKGIPAVDWLTGFTSASKEIFGDDWEPRLAAFLAFLRRRLTGDYDVDEFGFDPEVTERFFYAAIRPVAQKWFRVELRGVENVPTEGGALVVSNHSGTVPVDGLVTAVSLFDRTGRHLRPLGADLVFRLPFISEMARSGGATLACNEDAERMLRGGELVGVWPEGFKGIGKPFAERYKLQRFGRGGFVSAALRTGVPIIPTSVVGAEEIYPLVADIPSLARLLGVPYIPITPLFPFFGPLGMLPLPSKWLIEFGEPIRTDSYDTQAADDPMLVFNVTDQVRETIQQTLYSLLDQRSGVFSGLLGR